VGEIPPVGPTGGKPEVEPVVEPVGEVVGGGELGSSPQPTIAREPMATEARASVDSPEGARRVAEALV
jgi:hypothetical protein